MEGQGINVETRFKATSFDEAVKGIPTWQSEALEIFLSLMASSCESNGPQITISPGGLICLNPYQ